MNVIFLPEVFEYLESLIPENKEKQHLVRHIANNHTIAQHL